jgi:hypothetical protein
MSGENLVFFTATTGIFFDLLYIVFYFVSLLVFVGFCFGFGFDYGLVSFSFSVLVLVFGFGFDFGSTIDDVTFGYRWDCKQFPWLGIWEENRDRMSLPWEGKTVTRMNPFIDCRFFLLFFFFFFLSFFS